MVGSIFFGFGNTPGLSTHKLLYVSTIRENTDPKVFAGPRRTGFIVFQRIGVRFQQAARTR